MKKILLSTASSVLFPLFSFAQLQHDPLTLSGTYVSTCNLADSVFEEGFATKETLTFENNTITFQKKRYHDSLCLNEVSDYENDVTVVPFPAGEYAGEVGAGNMHTQPYYKSVMQYKDELGENVNLEVCFTLYTSNLSDKKEILYMGFTDAGNPDNRCSVDFDNAWIK